MKMIMVLGKGKKEKRERCLGGGGGGQGGSHPNPFSSFFFKSIHNTVNSIQYRVLAFFSKNRLFQR